MVELRENFEIISNTVAESVTAKIQVSIKL